MNDRFDKKIMQYIQDNEGKGMKFMEEYLQPIAPYAKERESLVPLPMNKIDLIRSQVERD